MRRIEVRGDNGAVVLERRLDRQKRTWHLGRGPTNELVVDDSRLSRQHIELLVEDDTVLIKDLGSTYGTTVNGQRLAANAVQPIGAGDRIVLGGRYQLALVDDTDEGTGTIAALGPRVGSLVKSNIEFFTGLLSSLQGRVKPLVGSNTDELGHIVTHFGDVIGQRLRELATVQEMSVRMNEIHDFDELLTTVIGLAIEVSGAERGFIMLYDDESGQLQTAVARGLEPAAAGDAEMLASQSIAERAFRRNEVVIIADALHDPEFSGQTSVVANTIRSVLSAPLQIRGEVVGVLYLDSRLVDHCFSERNLDFIKAFASVASFTLYNARLFSQAVTDGMTGLYNNKFFRQRLSEEIRRAARSSKPLALIMFDIDHFKKFNDTHGHQAGDIVIKGVARTIKTTVRNTDFAARYGGEEFAVILPDTAREGAALLAEKLRHNVQAMTLTTTEGTTLKVTASLGVTVFTGGDHGREDLIRAADAALYRSKEGGRNRVTLSDGTVE